MHPTSQAGVRRRLRLHLKSVYSEHRAGRTPLVALGRWRWRVRACCAGASDPTAQVHRLTRPMMILPMMVVVRGSPAAPLSPARAQTGFRFARQRAQAAQGRAPLLPR